MCGCMCVYVPVLCWYCMLMWGMGCVRCLIGSMCMKSVWCPVVIVSVVCSVCLWCVIMCVCSVVCLSKHSVDSYV